MYHTVTLVTLSVIALGAVAEDESLDGRLAADPPVIRSSWDDLLEGVTSPEDWGERRRVLKQRYLDLIRDDQKPAKPPLELALHESVVVDEVYTRKLNL